ncbi:hypothetical protein GCM10010275_19360 [Streptomyces litmocidini]|uniref:hypothetical protein n=1 Tax=Streptomyces litmocidini TaxID=67318 RepID=UPI00167DD549|nr:hypothetical protein [Streptomyces litmocidini]GGU84433.1 hypothetical protein GCM10010275_19360 [Streptomyces litmocidini]
MADQPVRKLTVTEHDRAWHAIESATGEPDADPGTVLAAVLHALRIEAPTAEDEQAYVLRKRASQAPSKSYEELEAECLAAMADADIASHPSRI